MAAAARTLPKGVLQNLGDELGVVSLLIQWALEQFKDWAESSN